VTSGTKLYLADALCAAVFLPYVSILPPVAIRIHTLAPIIVLVIYLDVVLQLSDLASKLLDGFLELFQCTLDALYPFLIYFI
jgi:hypothetical protein